VNNYVPYIYMVSALWLYAHRYPSGGSYQYLFGMA